VNSVTQRDGLIVSSLTATDASRSVIEKACYGGQETCKEAQVAPQGGWWWSRSRWSITILLQPALTATNVGNRSSPGYIQGPTSKL